MTITFNMTIQPAVLDLTNWELTHSGGIANPTSTLIAGDQIVLQFMGVTGVSLIAFSPPPFDVIGSNGVAAQPFSLPL